MKKFIIEFKEGGSREIDATHYEEKKYKSDRWGLQLGNCYVFYNEDKQLGGFLTEEVTIKEA